MPLWATVRLSCGNTSKRCLRSPCSAGRAPADRLRPSALMTYRLERCGIHVSGQCHGPTAKTVGGREREPAASPRPVRQRLGPWIVSHHASPPTDRKWRMWRAKMGRRDVGGALYNLKGFHPVNWKDIIFWPGDALCEAVHYGVKSQGERHIKEERKEKKERRSKKCGLWFQLVIV